MEKKDDPGNTETPVKTPVYILLDIDRVLFHTEDYYESGYTIFRGYGEDEGALPILKTMARLCVFSEITPQGALDLQKRKLRELGIDTHFDPNDIHIHEKKISKLPELLEKYRDGLVIIVDDKIEVLEEAKRLGAERVSGPQVYTVWLQRGPYAKAAISQTRTFLYDAAVLNLHELTLKVPEIIAKKRQKKAGE